MKLITPRQRILDFDIENRPLSYIAEDYTTGEITAIAAGFVGEGYINTWLLGEDDPKEMLVDFLYMFNEADIVTGHYIRGHDLPVLNGSLIDNGLPPLPDKMTHDTKLDLRKAKYVSMSQESLAASLGINVGKFHMNQEMWRKANRLTPEGLALTRKRVVGDVKQHKALRKKLLEIGWLNPPRVWHSARDTL